MDQEKTYEMKEFINCYLKILISSKLVEMEKDVIEVEVLEEHHNAKNTSKGKTKPTLEVWNFFEMLPLSVNNKQRCKYKKQRCKCKNRGTIYLIESKYGTDNMKRHIDACIWKIHVTLDNYLFLKVVVLCQYMLKNLVKKNYVNC